MYFCYVDESGDSGKYDPKNTAISGSPYFILAGLLVDARKWKVSLDLLKSFRKQLAADAYIPYDIEFHCSELITPHKIAIFNQMSVSVRWQLVRRFAEIIGKQIACGIITVVVDKMKSRLNPDEFLKGSITKLYQAYDEFLKSEKANGLVLFDRANEKAATTHVRKLMGTGSSDQSILGIRIARVIEDPIYRISSDSFFIQAADIIAYSLREQEFPVTARKKFNADRIFRNMLMNRCIKTSHTNQDGIIPA